MFSAIVNAGKTLIHRIKEIIKNLTKPETAVFATPIRFWYLHRKQFNTKWEIHHNVIP